MRDAVKDGVAEVVTGPATLLVYALTAIGVVLVLVQGADSETYQGYLDLIAQADVLIGALIGGRALAAGANSLGKGKVIAEKIK